MIFVPVVLDISAIRDLERLYAQKYNPQEAEAPMIFGANPNIFFNVLLSFNLFLLLFKIISTNLIGL